MRLDKFISTTTTLSRAEAKKIIKKGILINDILIKSSDYKVDENNDIVIVNGSRLVYQKYVYIMMNKPQNVISATEDMIDKTVVDILKDKDRIHKVFPDGLVLDDGYKCKSARLEILESSKDKSCANIYITEGKFHQVKRMMKALGTSVTYLKRLSIGSLILDENLKLGEYRYLTDKELKKINK